MMRDVIYDSGLGIAAPPSAVSRRGFFVQRPSFPVSSLIDGRYDWDRENLGEELIKVTDFYQRRPIPIGEDSQVEDAELVVASKKSMKTKLRIKTVFPFIFFPDDLIIDEAKVTIIKRYFFACQEIHTIPIKDIVDVIVASSLFFATLYIKRAFQNDLYQFNYLNKQDAMRARQLIQELGGKIGREKVSSRKDAPDM